MLDNVFIDIKGHTPETLITAVESGMRVWEHNKPSKGALKWCARIGIKWRNKKSKSAVNVYVSEETEALDHLMIDIRKHCQNADFHRKSQGLDPLYPDFAVSPAPQTS